MLKDMKLKDIKLKDIKLKDIKPKDIKPRHIPKMIPQPISIRLVVRQYDGKDAHL